MTSHLRPRFLLVIVCLLAPFGSLAAVPAGTTTASGVIYAYDAQPIARVDAH